MKENNNEVTKTLEIDDTCSSLHISDLRLYCPSYCVRDNKCPIYEFMVTLMQRGNRLLQGGTITQQCLMKALLVRRLCAVSQTGLIIEMICNMMTHLLGSKCRVFCVCEFYLQGHCGGDT